MYKPSLYLGSLAVGGAICAVVALSLFGDVGIVSLSAHREESWAHRNIHIYAGSRCGDDIPGDAS